MTDPTIFGPERDNLIRGLQKSAVDARSALDAFERSGRASPGWHMVTENGLGLFQEGGRYRLGATQGDCSSLALEHTREHAERIAQAWNARLTPLQLKLGCGVAARLRSSVLRITEEAALQAVAQLTAEG